MSRPLRQILLPGMDGTGELFGPLIAAAPGRDLVPIRREIGDPDAQVRAASGGEPFVLVAESWSGPAAIRLAARGMPGLEALVLVATFVRPPVPAPAWVAPLADLPLPAFVARLALLGWDAEPELVETLMRAIASVRPGLMRDRLREVLTVDVTAELAAVTVPTLYLGASRDRLVPASAMRDVLRALPTASTAWIDTPHLLLQRRPVEALAAIDAFLARSVHGR